MVHVASTRMVEQGTDGCSRGDLTEGVMSGHNMLQYVPLHLSALDRQPSLINWLKEWVPGGQPIVLDPEHWFDRGHGTMSGTYGPHNVWLPTEGGEDWFVWHPAPSLGDVALEELAESKHKRSHLSHVVLCPRLMTYAWCRCLTKLCDLVFEIPLDLAPSGPFQNMSH
jgi:hypothetical protein